MYQNKSEDRVITPSQLMLLPLDSTGTLNFMNFKNIGLNTLQESSAFSKIRNATKVYNTHLVHTSSPFTDKYYKINAIFGDENNYLSSMTFGLKRQHNLASISSLGNAFTSTTLDDNSFNAFLASNTSLSSKDATLNRAPTISPLSLEKETTLSRSSDVNRLQNLLSSANASVSNSLTQLLNYPSIISYLNDDSDKSGLQATPFKLSSPSLYNSSLKNNALVFTQAQHDHFGSETGLYSNLTFSNSGSNSRVFNLVGPNSKILLGDQSIRNFPEMVPNKSNLNISTSPNSVSSNVKFEQQLNREFTPYSAALNTALGYIDYSSTASLASSRSFNAVTQPAVLTTTSTTLDALNYDTTINSTEKTLYSAEKGISQQNLKSRAVVSDIFVGSREKTPRSMNTSYWSSF
jgi:hypothetical protein